VQDGARAVDVVIVGAGWPGMYACYRLRGLGLGVQVFEAGSDVGGTWYWNRYPGARCDVPSLNYCYSIPQIYDTWNWTERYAAQPEIEKYARFVADELNLRPSITFDTRVNSTIYDETAGRWLVETSSGERVSARWLVMATGGYSAPLKPNIVGLDSFKGELYYTAKWPGEDISYKGKRIGVIGTGSSGMQVTTQLGTEDEFDHLYVFQRTANFAVPAVNHPLDPEYQAEFKKTYADYWAQARQSGSGTVRQVRSTTVADMTDSEFEAYMAEAWRIGGPQILNGIVDLMVSEAANARVSEYLRRKLRERIDDPALADLLSAKGLFLGARRMLNEDGYFEVFNNPRVELVDVRSDPIIQLAEYGVMTQSGRLYELDMLILATGFDSGTGALMRIDIRGRDGLEFHEKWAAGPVTFLGACVSGFPNMFIIAGPGSPSIRSNELVSIEQHVDWIAELLARSINDQVDTVEAEASAEERWTDHVAAIANSTLLVRDDTQYVGANVPGKPRVFLAYAGGVSLFRWISEAVRDSDYEGCDSDYEGLSLLRGAVRVNAGDREWSGPPRDPKLETRFGASVI
jgi:cation diffusion facilitator CzcD-associated flavoprotein CzcO